MKRLIYIILITLFIPKFGICQVEGSTELKPFYSFYVSKKINYRWSADLYTLLAMKSFNQNFWLSQFNLAIQYKINKFYELSVGYGQSHYNYGNKAWWERHYPDIEPNFLGTARFQTLSARIKRDNNIGKKLKLSNRLIIQHYIPGFEKYETRIQYYVKLSYRKSNLPFRLKPFMQGAIYYYLNGVPVNYYDSEFNIVNTDSPNGFHRYRLRFGSSFRPFAKNKKLSIAIYYALNREFNIDGFGNNINTPRPSASGNTIYTSNLINNYNIVGLQINYFL